MIAQIYDTAIYQDYLKFKYIPEINELLDYRLALMDKLKTEKHKFPIGFLEKEILATDFLLTLKNK